MDSISLSRYLFITVETFSATLLIELTAPKLTIINYVTAQISSNERLNVTAQHDDPPLTLSCSTVVAIPILTWRGPNRLPSGVILHTSPDAYSVDLVWERNLLYSDSGQYVCGVIGSSIATAVLDLLVTGKHRCTYKQVGGH